MPTPVTTTIAAVVESAGAGFSFAEVGLAEPRPDEVIVRMVAAGICHTDLGVASGALPFPLPGVLGHEGAGVVEAVGAAVTRVVPGDHVLLSFTSCGGCTACRGGHPAYCGQWLPLNLLGGTRADGSHTLTRGDTNIGGHFFGQSSFAHHALVDERSVVKVPTDAPLDLLAPLGCGVMTGTGAVWNVLSPSPGDTLVITGAGAVGLSAVMAARLTPATRVIVVDRVPARLDLARELGATHTIDTRSADLVEAVAEITAGGGANGVIETTGHVGVLKSALTTLAARGTAVIVGAPAFGVEVPVDVNFMMPGRRVVGLTLGDAETQTLLPVLVELVRSGRLPVDRLVKHYPFEKIGEAVADTLSGDTIKPILRF
ncbi:MULTISPECIES: NAD(P)-dependent alcohol dehydrogenase [unclassified Streptomyces]|uniref:NAD(P)-dependent alcohol dehydrogenase n=1 Tax=unclassified Streptomyces TaxID=2593676 RepID=UPI00380053E3